MRHSIDPSPIRAVLFDLDNTLNDRTRSWEKFVATLIDPVEPLVKSGNAAQILSVILQADQGGYRPKDQFLADLQQNLDWTSTPTIEELHHLWRQQFPRCMVHRKGAIELLTKLKQNDLPVGIVTNGSTSMQQAKIDHMGLGMLVQTIVISESVGVKKPDRKIFEIALQGVEVAASETIFIGDNAEADIVGPSKMGMRTVWVRNGLSWEHATFKPDYEIDDLREIYSIMNYERR